MIGTPANQQRESGSGLRAVPSTPTPQALENPPTNPAEALVGISLPRTIAEWPRNKTEFVRVRLDNYKGRNTIDLRTWYPDDDGEMRPGRGITLSVKHVPALAEALAEALLTAEAAGLLEGDADG